MVSQDIVYPSEYNCINHLSHLGSTNFVYPHFHGNQEFSCNGIGACFICLKQWVATNGTFTRNTENIPYLQSSNIPHNQNQFAQRSSVLYGKCSFLKTFFILREIEVESHILLMINMIWILHTPISIFTKQHFYLIYGCFDNQRYAFEFSWQPKCRNIFCETTRSLVLEFY